MNSDRTKKELLMFVIMLILIIVTAVVRKTQFENEADHQQGNNAKDFNLTSTPQTIE